MGIALLLWVQSAFGASYQVAATTAGVNSLSGTFDPGNFTSNSAISSASYSYYDGPASFTMVYNGGTYSFNDLEIRVGNGDSGMPLAADQIVYTSTNAGAVFLLSANYNFSAFADNVLSSSLAGAANARLTTAVVSAYAGEPWLGPFGTVTGVTLRAVPEPDSLLLLFGAVCAASRRRLWPRRP